VSRHLACEQPGLAALGAPDPRPESVHKPCHERRMLVNGDPEADSGEDGAIAAIAKGAGTDKIGSITKAT